MADYETVVFDLDGTLVDSAPDLHAAANAMLADLGRAPVSLAQVTGFIGNGVGKLVERCLAATGDVAGQEAALARFRAHYDAAPAALTRPYPGVAAMLAALEGRRLALCTNKPEAPARALLAAFGWGERFAAVIGGDTVGALKPDPAPLLAALGATPPARALFVGDSETDAATARAAGVPFALFTGGYRKGPVEAMAPALVFDAHSGLPGLIAG